MVRGENDTAETVENASAFILDLARKITCDTCHFSIRFEPSWKCSNCGERVHFRCLTEYKGSVSSQCRTCLKLEGLPAGEPAKLKLVERRKKKQRQSEISKKRKLERRSSESSLQPETGNFEKKRKERNLQSRAPTQKERHTPDQQTLQKKQLKSPARSEKLQARKPTAKRQREGVLAAETAQAG